MTIEIPGTLEVDPARGVIYFHNAEGRTILRICSLPKPLIAPAEHAMLDITHMRGTSWSI